MFRERPNQTRGRKFSTNDGATKSNEDSILPIPFCQKSLDCKKYMTSYVYRYSTKICLLIAHDDGIEIFVVEVDVGKIESHLYRSLLKLRSVANDQNIFPHMQLKYRT